MVVSLLVEFSYYFFIFFSFFLTKTCILGDLAQSYASVCLHIKKAGSVGYCKIMKAEITASLV